MRDRLVARKSELERMIETWSARINELNRELQAAQRNLLVARGALGEIETLLADDQERGEDGEG